MFPETVWAWMEVKSDWFMQCKVLLNGVWVVCQSRSVVMVRAGLNILFTAPQERCFQLRPSVYKWRDWADTHWQTLHDESGSKWVCRIFFPQSWVCPARLTSTSKGILNLIQSYSQCFNGYIRVCLKNISCLKTKCKEFPGENPRNSAWKFILLKIC